MWRFMQYIFSVKSEFLEARKYQVITVFGIKIKRRIRPKNVIYCYYFQAEPNFGDLLNIALFKMFGFNIQAEDIKNSQIIAIGSLLQTLFREKRLSFIKKIQLKYQKPMIVYGAGFIENTPEYYHPIRKLDIKAVRGYCTLDKLKEFNNKNIIISQHTAIGDPGLLSRYLVDISNVEKKYDLGIIPHYVDKGNILLNNIQVKNSVIIDIQQEPETFLKQIAECRNVISSAMHGLIAADSFGIPNVRMVISDKITGGDYKYNDYYSAFGLKEHRVVNLTKQIFTDEDVSDIANNYKITHEQVEKICKDLLEQFPYKEGKCVLK